jgi:ABC-type nickel/cobalt efflux system permease component RcnA
MSRLVLLTALAALALPAQAAAHPLGNFTVNRFAAVEASGARVYVRYVLDLAEIPSLQERERVRGAGFAAALAARLDLRLDGRRAALRVVDSALRERPGAGGLPTLRYEAVYAADRGGRRLSFRDGNFASRLGWREVVVLASEGAEIVRSSAPATSPSRGLTAYPRSSLAAPLDVSSATATVVPGAGPGMAPALGGTPAAERGAGGLEGLVHHDASIGFVLLSLGLALFWGAAHALGPGHGKAIVAGYLVGTRGTPRHALLLGLIVTATHTVGVFALGIVTLALSAFVLPEDLYPWLNLVSALLVVAVGLGVLRSRLRYTRAHARGHHHHHHHHHGPGSGQGRRGLVGIGISGGIVPCPTALVVLLAAISVQRVGYGLVLIVAFSLGLAAAVTAIGLAAVSARRLLARRSLEGRLVRALPSVSAAVVLGLGLVMTARAVPALI